MKTQPKTHTTAPAKHNAKGSALDTEYVLRPASQPDAPAKKPQPKVADVFEAPRTPDRAV